MTVPEPPGPEVLQTTTSGVGVSKSPRKTTAIYTRRKTKTRTSKNPRRKWEKSEYMNALECLLSVEEKVITTITITIEIIAIVIIIAITKIKVIKEKRSVIRTGE